MEGVVNCNDLNSAVSLAQSQLKGNLFSYARSLACTRMDCVATTAMSLPLLCFCPNACICVSLPDRCYSSMLVVMPSFTIMKSSVQRCSHTSIIQPSSTITNRGKRAANTRFKKWNSHGIIERSCGAQDSMEDRSLLLVAIIMPMAKGARTQLNGA
eukprot:5030176-Amphidinium_carterae.1